MVTRVKAKDIKTKDKLKIDYEKIMKKHKDEEKIKKTATLVESTDRSHRTFVPFLDVDYTSDKAGWYKKLELIASKDSAWSESLVGKPVVTLEYFDGDVVIKMEYLHDSYEIQIPIFALHDMAIAAEVLNKFNENHMFTKVKMKTKKA